MAKKKKTKPARRFDTEDLRKYTLEIAWNRILKAVVLAVETAKARAQIEKEVRGQLGQVEGLEDIVSGIFRSEIRNALSKTLGQIRAEIEGNLSAREKTVGKVRYVWVATLENTCPDCLERHGKVKSWDEWVDEGVPNAAPTVCTIRGQCHCTLLPVDVVDLDEIREPIEIAKEKVAEYAKMRKEQGISLSREYKKSLLGQINNPDSVINR